MSNSLDRSVGTVRARECVIHINIAERSELFCKANVVLRFACVIPQVFQQSDVTVLERRNTCLDLWTDTVVEELYVRTQKLREFRRHGLE